MTETKVYARYIILGDEPPFPTVELYKIVDGKEVPRSITEICGDLNPRVRELIKEANDHFEGFSDTSWMNEGCKTWPEKYRWISVYPVTGNSEGHYIHVDVINGKNRHMVMMSKTFGGWEVACQIANAAGKLLGA
jgi:hypothetical protein